MSPAAHTDSTQRIGQARAAYAARQLGAAISLATPALADAVHRLDALEVMALANRAMAKLVEAERLLRLAVGTAPDKHWPRDDLAGLLLHMGRADAAEQVCREAIAADPANPNAWAMLGNLLSEREELVEGAVHLQQAVDLVGPHPQLQANLGRNLSRQGLLKRAEALLRQAVTAAPDSLAAHAWLAEVLEQDRRFDEASAALDAAEVLARREGSDVTLQRARLLARTAEWQRGLALLEREAALSGAALLQRGRLRDRAELYGEAWDDFVRGKAALARATERTYPAAAIKELVELLRTFFTAENITTLATAPIRVDVPQPIFILGFPRSGTTLTEQVLASHSRIRAGGELPFAAELTALATERTGGAYPRDFDAVPPDVRASLGTELRDHYLARAHAYGLLAPAADFFTDKMPLNELYLPLLRLAFPKAPLVRVARHPLDVMVSAMSHDFTHGFDCGYRLTDAASHFATMAGLATQWREALGFDAHLLRYESLVADQSAETEALMVHIGLEAQPAQLAFHELTRFAPTPSYAQVQEPLNDRSIGRWRHYADALAPARAILEATITEAGYAA